MLRIGEAAHPGPFEESSFVLGTANLAGAMNRQDCFFDLPHGLWGFTETHLTDSGFRTFHSALRARGKPMGRNLRAVAGAPAPPRVPNSDSGAFTGVATVSDFALRPIHVPWPGATYTSGRIQMTATFLPHCHLLGAVIYGAAQGPTFKDPLRITSDLLDIATQELVNNSRGLRYIVGDFNIAFGDLPHLAYWQSKGWKEIQLLQHSLTGREPQPTCKGATIRDYVWVSPELAALYQGLEQWDFVFPDHSILFARFACHNPLRTALKWHIPGSLPWDQIRKHDWHKSLSSASSSFQWTTDTTKDFARWSHRFELSLQGFANTSTGRLPYGCQGRGQRSGFQKIKPFHLVSKPSRQGEVTRETAIGSQVLHKWFKQLRRIQALRFNLSAKSETPGAAAYRLQCWQAILQSSGFKPSFPVWWSTRLVQLQGSPDTLSFFCPTSEEMECIFHDFHANFHSFERWTIRHRAKLAQLRKETEMKQLFRSLRPEQRGALDTLQIECSATIVTADPVDATICLDSDAFCRATEVMHQGHLAFVQPILMEDDNGDFSEKLHLNSDILAVPGQNLTSCATLTSFPDIEQELHKLWKPRWKAESTVPVDAWKRILAFSHAHMPRLQLHVPRLRQSDFLRLFQDSSGLRTTGPDGWAKEDIQQLPACLFAQIIQLLERVETGDPWPDQLVRGLVTCLEKVADAKSSAQFRPITLFSLWYRLWGSLRPRALLSALERYASFPAFGYLHGRSCQQMTFVIQAAVERAIRTGEDFCGVLADIEKCFNFLPRTPIFAMAKRLGIPSNVLTGWQSFLRQMVRAFRIQGETGTFLDSDTGFPEGDSMSCLAMCIANFSYHHYMLYFQPQVTAYSFVDNLEVTARAMTQLLQGHAAMECWADMLRLRLDQRKTSFWAVSAKTRNDLKALGHAVIESGLDLGTSMTYTASHRNAVMQLRIQSVTPLWRRLRLLRVSLWHKLLAVRMALLPRALHDTALIVIGKHWLDKLRSGVMRALSFARGLVQH